MDLYQLFIEGSLSRRDHLSRVMSIQPQHLELLCRQFNYAGENLPGRIGKAPINAVLTTLGVITTEELQDKLNQKWKPYQPSGAQSHQKTGPMLLLYLINCLWRNVIKPVPPHLILPYENMIDPEWHSDDLSHSMPSPEPGGFKKLGIAFRVDSRAYEELPAAGFVARYAVPPGDPYHIEGTWGTIASKGMAWDKVHRDFASETGVSVSRNPIGSIKFLLSAKQPIAHMYAVKFESGFDTEAAQMARQEFNGDKTALWRPGEKAAHQIPKWKIIASCKFERSSRDQEKFRRLTEWKYYWRTGDATRYIEKSTKDMVLNTDRAYSYEKYDFVK